MVRIGLRISLKTTLAQSTQSQAVITLRGQTRIPYPMGLRKLFKNPKYIQHLATLRWSRLIQKSLSQNSHQLVQNLLRAAETMQIDNNLR
jgi:predicted esterase